jgi:hypothetical protein
MNNVEFKLKEIEEKNTDMQKQYEMKKSKIELQDLNISRYAHTQMRGFSFMWPYVAFSGVESNTLMVVNAF